MATETFNQVALLLAPTTALFQAGYSFSFSQNSVLALYSQRPHVGTAIFRHVYYTGAAVAAPSSIISSGLFAYLAYATSFSARRRMYSASAVMTILPVIYTSLYMYPGIKRLVEISESVVLQDKSEQTLEHLQLLKSWVFSNYLRAALYMTGGLTGLWTVVFG